MQIKKQSHLAGTTPMGTELNILSYELDSGKAGKRVYIQSGVHGGEVTQWLQHELFAFLEKNLQKGQVVLVPCANPVSWTQRAYYSTNGKFDFYMGKDWNRNFPGNANGSLGERIAGVLMSLAQGADFALDLHTSRESIPFSIYSDDSALPYIKTLGMAYNQLIPMSVGSSYSGTMNAALDSANIPNLCIECGSHDAYEPQNIQEVLDGIKRLLASFEMIEASLAPVAPKEIKTFCKTVKYGSPVGGILRLAKQLGDKVKEGEDLFYCFDNNKLGQTIVEKSKHNGVLFKASPTYIYWSGDDVLQILLDEDTKTLTTAK